MSDTRILRALKALFPALLPERPYLPLRKYRLVRMRPSLSSSDNTRAELQIVTKAVGLPDKLFVPVWPGLAGSWSELAPGTFVLVSFIDADPEQPFVHAFATADDPAWRPLKTTIDCSNEMKLGPSAAAMELVGSNTDTVSTPGDEAGRYVKYGDTIMFPSGAAATLTALPILGSAPGAVGAPLPPITVSRVR